MYPSRLVCYITGVTLYTLYCYSFVVAHFSNGFNCLSNVELKVLILSWSDLVLKECMDGYGHTSYW